jgi:hypothetical protein
VITSVATVRVAEQAEDLIRTLPGVVSVRVVDDPEGAIQEVHILTTSEISAKQTVRNVESALLAHLGVRIDHRRISVAATTESPPPLRPAPVRASAPAASSPLHIQTDDVAGVMDESPDKVGVYSPSHGGAGPRRKIYFEDVEVRGSRARGVSCRVTLMKDGTSFIGEARGVDGDRARLELSARATCLAISDADGQDRQFGLEGLRIFDAFERRFIFVGVTVRSGRESRLLAGTCEVVDSTETAAALAVLDATNRWIEFAE